MPRFYLVDLESIECTTPRSQFNVQRIDDLAHNLIETGSLLQPLVLEATGPESYRIISGEEGYYAGIRASEINAEIEMVDAFVIEADKVEAANAQIRLMSGSVTSVPIGSVPTDSATTDSATINNDVLQLLNARISNLETRHDQDIRDLKVSYQKDIDYLQNKVANIEGNMSSKLKPLDMLNQLSEVDLFKALKKAGIPGKTLENLTKNIINARKTSPFDSFTDVVSRTDKLGDKTMLKIIDTWSGF
ncbi:ParB N-terminal domain-containing protein [Prochlorothrix hollandica]|uniref:ParB N-terminal domain-containing protein n=1 Tax=Prochlorothrix hollandica TaxID=1223 RepID=UPI00333E6A49